LEVIAHEYLSPANKVTVAVDELAGATVFSTGIAVAAADIVVVTFTGARLPIAFSIAVVSIAVTMVPVIVVVVSTVIVMAFSQYSGHAWLKGVLGQRAGYRGKYEGDNY